MSALAMLTALGNLEGITTAEIVYRAKRDNSLARHIVKLDALIPTLSGVNLEAATEILKSRQESLQKGIGNNSDYTCKDVYVHLDDMQGVKAHKETGVVYISGRSMSREVLEEGIPLPPVKSSPKTLAKKEISKSLQSNKFRQFILKNITKAEVFGVVLKVEAEG